MAMRRHAGIEEVQEFACEFLANLTDYNEGLTRVVVQAVVAGMTRLTGNVKLHEKACKALVGHVGRDSLCG